MDIAHSTSFSQLFSTTYFFLIFSYLIWKYIQLFRHPHIEGLVFQPKLLQRCFQRACISSVRDREMFWGICSQMQLTLHDFKLLQCKRNVLSSFTISSHKGSSGRILVSAEDKNLTMYVCVCVYACFKGKPDFSTETPLANQCGALCLAWSHPSVQSQNEEMENNLHIICVVSLFQWRSVLYPVLLRFSNLFLNSLWLWLLLLPLGYYSTT